MRASEYPAHLSSYAGEAELLRKPTNRTNKRIQNQHLVSTVLIYTSLRPPGEDGNVEVVTVDVKETRAKDLLSVTRS